MVVLNGSVVVCTDTDGFKELVIPDKTGLLSPACDPRVLANNIIRLIRDRDLRIALARTENDMSRSLPRNHLSSIFKSLLVEDEVCK
jgi:glycosyltransferase involved in cell wall biosynthesis